MKTKSPFLLCILIFASQLSAQSVSKKEVQLSGNAYVTAHDDGGKIGRNGLERWTDPKSEIKTFVYFSKPQTIRVALNGSLDEGKSLIKVGVEPV